MYPESVRQFVKSFSKLPGIGEKSAERLGFHILNMPEEFARELADSLIRLRFETKVCSVCGNIDDRNPCSICSDAKRDRSKICVVEEVMDIYSIEETHSYKGLYHVLGGVISPINGVLPADLNISSLIERVKEGGVEEIIFATSPTTEGDTTMFYIKDLLNDSGIKFTHLARGIPVGAGVQYADNNSISEAFKNRENL